MRKSAILSVLAAMVMLAACGPEEVSSNGNGSGGGNNTPEPVKVTEISVAQDKINVTSAGGSFTVQVTSNATLSVSVSSDWVHQSGSGYSFTADHNPGYDPRSCTITFSADGKSKSVTVTQAQQDAIIPGETQYELFYEAQTFTLPVSTNVDLTVAPTVSWIKSQDTRALSQKNFSFSIEENSSKEPREGIIEITSGSLRQSIKVVQLPTTHRPESDDDWSESIEMSNKITEEKAVIISRLHRNGVYDAQAISDSLYNEVKGIIWAKPSADGSSISILQRDSVKGIIRLYDPVRQGIKSKVDASYSSDNSVEVLEPSDAPSTRATTTSSDNTTIIKNGGRALMLFPNQKHFEKPIDEWYNILDRFFDVDSLLNSNATAEKFLGENLDDYDFILIDTHGGIYNEQYNILETGSSYSKALRKLLKKKGYTGEYLYSSEDEDGLCYLAMTPDFLINCSFDNTAVILSACHSAETRRMVHEFRSKGASFVSGTNRTTSTIALQVYIDNILNCLQHGFSIGDAHKYAAESDRAKEWTDHVMERRWNTEGQVNITEEMVLEEAIYDNLQRFYDPKKEYYFFKPQLTLNETDGVLFSWNSSLDPFSAYWRIVDSYYSYYDDNKKEVERYLYHDVPYDLSVVYKLFIDGNYNSMTTAKQKTLDNISLALGHHSAYVVAYVFDGDEEITSFKSNVVDFEVTAPEVPDTPAIKVTGVKVNPGTVTLEEGMSVELTATITPTDATNQKVIWSSDHPEFATVDQTGVVTAVAANGSTRVYVTATTEDGNKTARCRVYVKEATGNRVPVSGISFAQSSAEVELGKTLQLTAGISPMNATNRSIQWFSSDPSVVAVSDGLLSGKKLGTVTITAKTIDGGFTASLEVTVVEKVEDPTVHVSRVSLDKGSLNMKVGESATLKATVSPSNATNKGVTWTSSMNAVATVTSDGVVTAKAAGTAIITVRTDDGGKAATCNVIVVYEPEPVGEIKVNGVTISPMTVNLNVGDSHQFSYRLSPENATNQEVSWSSSDPSVASVDSKGLVVGKSEGKANIIVTTSDGGMVSKASVTVSNAIVPVTGVTISPTEMTMNIGETKPYTLTILPENASNMEYILYTDNYDVASFDTDNQTIVARKWGTANVTVSTTDGGYKATCKVTVIKPPMSISVAPSTLSFGDVNVGETSTKSFTISNTGEFEVNVKDIIPGTAFDINASVPFKIGVGKSVSIDVTFHPTDAKSYTEVISFNTDADNYPTLMLTGTGLKTSSAETFEAVDLGLSVKWANMNLGASSSAEVGSFFSWGSTNPNATTNPYYDGDQYVSKYAHDPKGGSFVDYKEYLEGKDDAAHAILGGNWRMPTPQEVKELLDKCSIKSENGKSILTGPNGNSIELIYRVNYDEYDYWTSGRSGYDVGYESGVGTFNGVSFYYDSRWQLRKTLTRDKKLLIRPVQGNRPDFEPQIKIVQSSLDFGTIKIGQTGKATITIKNTGERLLHIFGVDIPENFSIVFTSSDDPNLQLKFNSWRLAPGCSVTGEVTFGPMSQDFGKQITFYTNSVSNRTVSIPITANVIKEPLMDVVDLGTGIGWGTRNLGASSETDFGDYYALGELTPKTSFSLESYRFYDSETESYTKYTTRYASLDRSDDPVAQKLGGRWRLPTGSEGFKNQSTTHNVERNGVMGTVIKSVQEGYKGNSLFIPYAGYINSNGEEAVGKYAMLLYAQTGSSADLMSYSGFPSSAYTIPRWCGVQIRPVCDKISDRSHVKNLFWNYYRETYNL